MTSEKIRDPIADHLLTPENCALAIIDYQPVQVKSVKSMDHEQLIDNVVRDVRATNRVVHGQREHRGQRTDDQPTRRCFARNRGDRSHHDEFVGGRRLQARGGGNRSEEARHGGTVDRGVLDVSTLGRDT